MSVILRISAWLMLLATLLTLFIAAVPTPVIKFMETELQFIRFPMNRDLQPATILLGIIAFILALGLAGLARLIGDQKLLRSELSRASEAFLARHERALTLQQSLLDHHMSIAADARESLELQRALADHVKALRLRYHEPSFLL